MYEKVNLPLSLRDAVPSLSVIFLEVYKIEKGRCRYSIASHHCPMTRVKTKLSSLGCGKANKRTVDIYSA